MCTSKPHGEWECTDGKRRPQSFEHSVSLGTQRITFLLITQKPTARLWITCRLQKGCRRCSIRIWLFLHQWHDDNRDKKNIILPILYLIILYQYYHAYCILKKFIFCKIWIWVDEGKFRITVELHTLLKNLNFTECFRYFVKYGKTFKITVKELKFTRTIGKL